MDLGVALVLAWVAAVGEARHIPPPVLFETSTELIALEDALPVLGLELSIPFIEGDVVLRWDVAERVYRFGSAERGDGEALRVARLRANHYILQHASRGSDFTLLPFRITEAGDLSPLSCEVAWDTAESYRVGIGAGGGFTLRLTGTRPDIIGLLGAISGSCRPLLQLPGFSTPAQQLLERGSAPGDGTPVHSECLPCPQGRGGCIQGSVAGASEDGFSDVAVTAAGRTASATVRIASPDARGRFFVDGLSDGGYELVVSAPRRTTLVTEGFYVRGGFTYVFEEPLVLREATVEEALVVAIRPSKCHGRAGVGVR